MKRSASAIENTISPSPPESPSAAGIALLVVNRQARSGRSDLEQAIETLAAGRSPPTIVDVEDPPRLASQLESALTPAVERIIVAGGDGTVNSALPVLVRAGKPFGILPLGTANDLAKTLNIPASPVAAASVIVRGHTRRIDVGSVNGKYFLNAAGIGFSSDLQRELDSTMKSKLGPLAYPVGVLRRWRRHRPFTAVIRGEDIFLQRRVIQVTVANGRFYGGGMTAHEDARIDDATLDILLILHRPLWHYLVNALRLRRGVYAKDAPVIAKRAMNFELSTRHRKSVATDGEPTTFTPAAFRVSADALEVYVPDESA
jgi:diacylglycerol kinase (ATP)